LLKILFSAGALLFYIYYKKIPFEKVSLKKLVIQTNLINVINFLLTYYGMQHVKGTMTATINCLAPAIMFMVSVSFWKWNWKIILSLVTSFLGFLIAIHFQLFHIGEGIFFLIGALFVYNFGSYRLKNITHNTYIYNLYMFMVAFLEFIIILLFQNNHLFKTVNAFYLWLFILTSGIGYAYIQCVYFLSVHSIGPLKTSFFMAFSPVFTYFFSLILLL